MNKLFVFKIVDYLFSLNVQRTKLEITKCIISKLDSRKRNQNNIFTAEYIYIRSNDFEIIVQKK